MWAERLICVMTLLVSVVLLGLTFSFPKHSTDPGGMALFPRVAAISASLSATAILVRAFWQRRVDFHRATRSLTANLRSLHRQRVVWTIILSIGYPFLITRIGFAVATTLFVFALVKLFKGSTVQAVIFALVLAAGVYGIFIYGLNAYVPPGDWVELLGI